VVLGAVLLLGTGHLVSAQDLPPLNTGRLSPAQEAQVREYVQSRLEVLASDAVATSEGSRARRELIEPMTTRETSVAMRQAFATAANEPLTRMVSSQNEQQAVSALLIAGNIADRTSLAVIEAGLADGREAVQMGASAGAKAMVRVLSGRLGGAQADRQEQVQNLLGDTLAVTSSGHVAQSTIAALTALPDDPAFVSVSGAIIADAMAGQVSRRRSDPNITASQAIANGWAGAMERAISAQLAYQRAAAIAGADVDRDTQLQSARLAGISLSIVRDAIEEARGDDLESMLQEHARLIRGAETLLILVESNLTARTDRVQNMGRLLEAGNVDGLVDAMNNWVGPRGILTGAPFSIPAGTLGN
jgi:hypothetical protein